MDPQRATHEGYQQVTEDCQYLNCVLELCLSLNELEPETKNDNVKRNTINVALNIRTYHYHSIRKKEPSTYCP